MNTQIPVIKSFEARVGLDEAVVVISVVGAIGGLSKTSKHSSSVS